MTRPTSPRKSAGNARGRPFEPGNPGKPKGTRHRVTRAIEDMLEGESEALSRKAIDKALDGDSVALRLCLDRIAPAKKDGPISFDLPAIQSAADLVIASAAVISAVSAGDVTPDEGGRVMALLASHKAIIEAGELERRIAELEARATK